MNSNITAALIVAGALVLSALLISDDSVHWVEENGGLIMYNTHKNIACLYTPNSKRCYTIEEQQQ